MKNLLLFASIVTLLAGCATENPNTSVGAPGPISSSIDAGYGSGVAPTQQGAGAAGLVNSSCTLPD